LHFFILNIDFAFEKSFIQLLRHIVKLGTALGQQLVFKVEVAFDPQVTCGAMSEELLGSVAVIVVA
jgi:hypothetical protein